MATPAALKLPPNSNIQEAEYVRKVWVVTAEPDTTPQDLTKPEYWLHVFKKFKNGDYIEVVSAEGDWLAKLYVRSVQPTGIVLHLFPVEYVGEPPQKISEEYSVQLAGKGKWRVVRNSDKSELVTGKDTREMAESWLTTYLKR